MNALLIVACIAALAVLMLVGMFNSLVGLRNQVKNAWAQIDVQLKRRYDLIPNLVETAKGYVQHERQTLESITQARSRAMSSEGMGARARAEGELTEAVNKFFLVVENYPDLKANQNFLTVQEELRSTENKIAFSRQNYNDQVLFYNNKIEMFPSNLIAGMFGFGRQESFELQDQAQREVPRVNFS